MIRILFFLIPFLLFADKPNLLLLEVYKDQNITGWVMSEKLDGIRAYWNGKNLFTRSGKIINAPKWFTQNYPPFEIDGELWTKRGNFENISSIVRDQIPTDRWKEVTHNIFEIPHAQGDLFARLTKLKSYEGKIIKILPQIPIENQEHLKRFLKTVEAKGGEGVVVRDPNAPYIDQRTSKVLKVKSFQDEECEVVGYSEGKGKFKGLVGALECQREDGIEFKIGSGLSLDERKNPPAIGSRVTFKYQGLTKYGKPRFPVFLRVRNAL